MCCSGTEIDVRRPLRMLRILRMVPVLSLLWPASGMTSGTLVGSLMRPLFESSESLSSSRTGAVSKALASRCLRLRSRWPTVAIAMNCKTFMMMNDCKRYSMSRSSPFGAATDSAEGFLDFTSRTRPANVWKIVEPVCSSCACKVDISKNLIMMTRAD